MGEALNTSPYRRASFWLDRLAQSGADDLSPRPALDASVSADVCIVGAGLTGLWTAYYLAKAHPRLRIVVLEKDIAGFGASGRNGGWCSALFPLSPTALEERYGFEQAVAMRRAMVATVDEVERVCRTEQIDCDFVKGGTLGFVRSRPQLEGARAELAEAAHFGVDKPSLLGTAAVAARFGAPSAAAAVFTPECARVQPAKLTRGLAKVVESLGVTIYEQTRVTGWKHGRVSAIADAREHIVTAQLVVSALEGYGSAIPQIGRRILPLYSLMIATEPLPEPVWDRIGIRHGETFADYRHLIIYGQRTADNRFAFGGRGARYHLGSAIRPSYDQVARVSRHLQHALADLFPDAQNARITHRWGGPLGVPRDWHASVGIDRSGATAWAGGYVGDGLSTTNLAGRTLADLITDTPSELTRLPWVDHRSPRWEPEPLRFIGANAGLLGTQLADAEEKLTGRPSLTSRLLAPLTGH